MTSLPTESTQAAKPTVAGQRRLIVNADDFGFNREVTDGIVEAHLHGVVTSTTLMVNMPAAQYAVDRSRDCPQLSVGLHVNLTAGRPLSHPDEIPTLVDRRGMFFDEMTFFKRGMWCRFASAELALEMRRQFEHMFELGLTPTHADSHHHAASCLQPFFIKLRLMKEFGVTKMRTHRGWYRGDRSLPRVRRTLQTGKVNLRRSPFRLYYEFQHLYCRRQGIKTPSERYSLGKVVSDRPMDFTMASVPAYLDAMPIGVNELCCHPGYMSEDPLDELEFRLQRRQELTFFTNPELQAAVRQAHVELISYRDL